MCELKNTMKKAINHIYMALVVGVGLEGLLT